MIMLGSHVLDKVFGQYQIKYPSQDPLYDSTALVESLFPPKFDIFQWIALTTMI